MFKLRYELLRGSQRALKNLRRRDINMLIFVILSSSLTFVFSFNCGSFLVAILKIGVDFLGDSYYLIFDVGATLNLISIHLSLVGLCRDVILDLPLYRRHRYV
jgi:hypothetical protein